MFGSWIWFIINIIHNIMKRDLRKKYCYKNIKPLGYYSDDWATMCFEPYIEKFNQFKII